MTRYHLAIYLQETLIFAAFVAIMRAYKTLTGTEFDDWQRIHISIPVLLLTMAIVCLRQRARMSAGWKHLDEETKGTGDSFLLFGIGCAAVGFFLVWTWWLS